MNEAAARRTLRNACRMMYNKDLLVSAGGNLSIRCGDHIIITPSGRNKGSLSPGDMVKMDADGNVIGKGRPSIEHKFHLSVYKKRSDVNAVVHCHPLYCIALTIKGWDVKPFTPEGAILLGDVPTIPYLTPGSEELAAEIENMKGTAALMERHGAVTLGKTMEEACDRMEELEFQAHLRFAAGDADGLPEEEIKKLRGMK